MQVAAYNPGRKNMLSNIRRSRAGFAGLLTAGFLSLAAGAAFSLPLIFLIGYVAICAAFVLYDS